MQHPIMARDFAKFALDNYRNNGMEIEHNREIPFSPSIQGKLSAQAAQEISQDRRDRVIARYEAEVKRLTQALQTAQNHLNVSVARGTW